MNTNLQGTFVLLEAAKKHNIELFMQISNASVYGSIEVGSAKETEPLRPSGCYSMSKAAADQLALRYSQFHSLPVIISRTANVYGPNQDVQKVIPQFITAALEDGKVEIYGNGSQIRDLVYVDDVCQALDLLIEKGTEGEIYNIGTGGPGERTTLQVCQKILEMMGKSADLIQYIHDRPMHDFRWSMDTSKIRELGWVPLVSFEDGLNRTVRWYICNKRWWQGMRKQAYSEFETEEKTFSIPRLASTSGRSLHTIQA